MTRCMPTQRCTIIGAEHTDRYAEQDVVGYYTLRCAQVHAAYATSLQGKADTKQMQAAQDILLVFVSSTSHLLLL